MTKWEEISDVLTEDGMKNIKTGQVLIFNYEGSPLHLKVKRKSNGKVWAEPIHLFSPEEIDKYQKGKL